MLIGSNNRKLIHACKRRYEIRNVAKNYVGIPIIKQRAKRLSGLQIARHAHRENDTLQCPTTQPAIKHALMMQAQHCGKETVYKCDFIITFVHFGGGAKWRCIRFTQSENTADQSETPPTKVVGTRSQTQEPTAAKAQTKVKP